MMSNMRRNTSRAREREVAVGKQAEVEQRPMMTRLRPNQRGQGDRCQRQRNDRDPRRGTGGGQSVQSGDERHHEDGEQAEPQPVHRVLLSRLPVPGFSHSASPAGTMARTFSQKFARHPA